MSIARLPDALTKLYGEKQSAIRARLNEFAAVSEEYWFYELCFCLCTPQSSAVHAFAVQQELQRIEFYDHGQDILSVLRQPDRYIRFHNTKHRRLHKARIQWPDIYALLKDSSIPGRVLRDMLSKRIDGIGLKEASHFLRNIGWKNLAIIDRHLLTNLVRCNVYDELPSLNTQKRYHDVERAFESYCIDIGIAMDEVDLLFWCAQTGHILK